MTRMLLQIEIEQVSNGYVLSSYSADQDETFLAGTVEEARLYLEAWVKTWFDDHKVERIREVN